MKNAFVIFTAVCLVLFSGISKAQTLTSKTTPAEEPTPANVLKWTKEVLPKMEALSGKIGKIKTANSKDARERDMYMTAVRNLKAINARGAKLTAAEARKHNSWFLATVNSFYIECQSQNGNVCCIDCHNHGILGVWCYANCFVARFPDNDN